MHSSQGCDSQTEILMSVRTLCFCAAATLAACQGPSTKPHPVALEDGKDTLVWAYPQQPLAVVVSTSPPASVQAAAAEPPPASADSDLPFDPADLRFIEDPEPAPAERRVQTPALAAAPMWWVSLSSWQNPGAADHALRMAQRTGLSNTRVQQVEAGSRSIYRLLAGPYEQRDQAAGAQRTLRREFKGAWILQAR